jgi:DNA polymerase-3 subunit delta'
MFEKLPHPDTLKEKLIQMYASGKIPHAILFEGKEGSGNLAIALSFARLILCDQATPTDACGVCASCKKTEILGHPDLFVSYPYPKKDNKPTLSSVYFDKFRQLLKENVFPSVRDWQEKLGSSGVKINIYTDEAKDLAKRVSLKSYSGKKKIMLLWLPEYLGEAGNSILKLIEEPPENTLFFLVSENSRKVLTTILSRTQKIKIPNPTHSQTTNYLCKEYGINQTNAETIALLSRGNMNKAIKNLNNVEEPYFEPFTSWLRDCYSYKLKDINTRIEELNKNGREFIVNFLTYGMELIRESFYFSNNTTLVELPEKEMNFVVKFANLMEGKEYTTLYSILSDSIRGIEGNGNSKLILTDTSIQIKNLLRQK